MQIANIDIQAHSSRWRTVRAGLVQPVYTEPSYIDYDISSAGMLSRDESPGAKVMPVECVADVKLCFQQDQI